MEARTSVAVAEKFRSKKFREFSKKNTFLPKALLAYAINY
jgi:hypothetical protein